MRTFVIAVAACFLLGTLWAQKSPTYQESNQNSTATHKSQTKTDKSQNAAAKTYKGTLMDASCAGNGNASNNNTAAKTEKNAADRTNTEAPAKQSGTTDQNKACMASTSTREFALRTTDGQVLRFDAVGNERAMDAIKNQKKWNSDASNGKTITAKVSGTQEGDTLTVVSIQ